MKQLIAILLLIAPVLAGAQEKLMFLNHASMSDIPAASCAIKDSIDTGRSGLTAFYRLTRLTNKDTDSHKWSVIRMQVGEAYTVQTDMRRYVNDIIWTNVQNTGTLTPYNGPSPGDAESNLFMQLIQDNRDSMLTVVCPDMHSPNRHKVYSESIPEIKWTIGNQVDSLHGYKCHSATADFRGRKWTVWFTPEIAINAGPWKLSGLPGLILKAGDEEGAYIFDLMSLHADENPIFIYKYPAPEMLTREKYLRYERNCRMQPFETFANGEEAIIWTREIDGSTKKLDESWELPYYPIER